MKIKEGFILQEVADSIVALPVGGEVDMMITLNESGSFLWRKMETEISREDLILALQAEYEIDEKLAKECVDNFVEALKTHDFLA